MVMLVAHSANGAGMRHPLDAHLRGTAALAREFAERFGAGDLAAYLGLVHDVGKADCAWQERLAAVEAAGGRVGIDHKMAGTWLASRSVGVFAAAVNGHHGGLPAGADLKNELGAADTDVQAGWAAAIEEAAAFVPEVTPAAPPSLPAWLDGKDSGDPLVTDLLIRLVFSALVDADFLDPDPHFRRAARPRGQLAAGDLADR
jgi:CRISPR-associated endonuclease/helicase Cas3